MGHYSKREEYRNYLERSGDLEKLTKVLVTLYEEPEKPSNAVDFLKHHIGGAPPDSEDVETLLLELAEANVRNKELEDKMLALKEKIKQLEGKETSEDKTP